jgi:hypothetical protein
VLVHWNNSPRVDMLLHSHTLSWLLFLLNATNTLFLLSLAWLDWASNRRSTAFEATMLTITPPMGYISWQLEKDMILFRCLNEKSNTMTITYRTLYILVWTYRDYYGCNLGNTCDVFDTDHKLLNLHPFYIPDGLLVPIQPIDKRIIK